MAEVVTDSIVSDAWASEEVEKIVSESIEGQLKDQTFSEENVSQWNNSICESVMAKLIETRKPLKYAVESMIMQRNGSGLHSATSCFFDTQNDGLLTYLWPKEKSKDQPNKTMTCLVTVFGVEL